MLPSSLGALSWAHQLEKYGNLSLPLPERETDRQTESQGRTHVYLVSTRGTLWGFTAVSWTAALAQSAG